MGSRGRMLGDTFGRLPNEYNCVNIVNDTKVLEWNEKPGHLKLPDISHTKPNRYLIFDKDGTFHQFRIYDYSGRPIIDIDYGVHAKFGKNPTLHVHKWKGSIIHGDMNNTHLFTKKDYQKYKKYLKGVIKDEWIN